MFGWRGYSCGKEYIVCVGLADTRAGRNSSQLHLVWRETRLQKGVVCLIGRTLVGEGKSIERSIFRKERRVLQTSPPLKLC